MYSNWMNHEKHEKHKKRVPPTGQTAFRVVETSSSKSQWRIQTWRLGGGSQMWELQKCLHLLKYQRLSATKEVIFCRSKSGYFCWSNYAIFHGIAAV